MTADRPATEPRHAPAIGLSSAGRHTLCMGCGEPWPCRSAEASRPSDEKETQRVQGQCDRFRHDEHCAHLHES